jgi:hypothetical protein
MYLYVSWSAYCSNKSDLRLTDLDRPYQTIVDLNESQDIRCLDFFKPERCVGATNSDRELEDV